jgi:hypothetical protein
MLRLLAIFFTACYILFVVAFAAAKVIFKLSGPWAEVFYGPAITAASMWLMLALGILIERRLRGWRSRGRV